MKIKFDYSGFMMTKAQLYKKRRQISEHNLKNIKTLFRGCVRAFIKGTVDAMGVDTGMAAASLAHLAKQVRYRNHLMAMIHGRVKSPAKYRVYHSTMFGPDGNKSIAYGMRKGTKNEITFGTKNKRIFTMTFSISVLQHFLWEHGKAYRGKGEMWNSIEAGVLAFLAYYKANAKKYLPAIAWKTIMNTGKLPISIEEV